MRLFLSNGWWFVGHIDLDSNRMYVEVGCYGYSTRQQATAAYYWFTRGPE